MQIRSFQATLLFFALVALWRQASCRKQEPWRRTPKIALPDNIIHSWANYAPAFPVKVYEPPVGCTITQVNILQRHGARFPTSGATARIVSAVSKFQNATAFNEPFLEFLTTYKYDLGHDDLIGFGAAQAFDSGQEAFKRYRSLVSRDEVPFVRTSSGSRVVLSANNWTAGFSFASNGVVVPPPPLLLNEAGNDTLDDKMCDNAGDSVVQTDAWQNAFGPFIAQRLNKAAPGVNLTNADIPSLISLCAFETLAKETPSPWCGVFTQQDFENYEYFGDLDKYYKTGYGGALGPVQGVGYVNELIARLTQKPVSDATQTNRTLDSSPATFPLDRTLYADHSHDNQMIAIYAAMGILRPFTPLDPIASDPQRTWLASHLVPFASKLVTERLVCDGRASVRMLLNDAVVPLEICGGNSNGICTLDAFVRSQSYSKNNGEGDWEKCFS
ncbi:phosphoglycerate mutase-like protein [Ramaria rubella]|nr:phosphoglycerate mutase-like protein [Ramaria rubella]